jgi:hypothetical protein
VGGAVIKFLRSVAVLLMAMTGGALATPCMAAFSYGYGCILGGTESFDTGAEFPGQPIMQIVVHYGRYVDAIQFEFGPMDALFVEGPDPQTSSYPPASSCG